MNIKKIYAYMYQLWNGQPRYIDTYMVAKPMTVLEADPKRIADLREMYHLIPNCTITNIRSKWAKGLQMFHNPEFHYDFAHFGLIPVLPQDKVWIYNVSRQQHEIVGHPILAKVIFPAAKEDEDYAVVTSIPRVMRYAKNNVDTGAMDVVFEDGRRIAMDLINPDNFGLDQNKPIGHAGTSAGRDLGAKGVFWSMKNPPGKLEVRLAKKRMEVRYKFLLEQAATVQKADPKLLKETITPEHHAAADYMGGTYIWHGERLNELKVLAAEVEAIRYLSTEPGLMKADFKTQETQ
jgi:hypothetical protein